MYQNFHMKIESFNPTMSEICDVVRCKFLSSYAVLFDPGQMPQINMYLLLSLISVHLLWFRVVEIYPFYSQVETFTLRAHKLIAS